MSWYSGFESFIGLRYFRVSGRQMQGNRFLSVISGIALGGVALGVAVLLVVLSVMNGFERELRDRILGITAHATITGFGAPLSNWQAVRDQAGRQPGVVGATPYIEQEAMLIAAHDVRSDSSGVMLRGVLPEEEARVASLSKHMQSGRFEALSPGEYGIVLGSELAKSLGVQVGDTVVAVTAQASVTIAGVMPRSRRFMVVGIFNIGMYEYDRNFAYVHMQDAAKLYRLGEDVTGVRLKLANVFNAQQLAMKVARDLGGGYYVDDWTHRHANFFRSIALTKSMMFLILLLVVAVAAFNVIATLVMVVKDKHADIAILRTLGASPRHIMTIFIVQGVMIGMSGVIAGVLLGTLLSWNIESIIHGLEALFHTQFMDAKLYFMSDLPADVQWPDVMKVSLVAFGMCALATLYPAWRASRVQPAQALRHE